MSERVVKCVLCNRVSSVHDITVIDGASGGVCFECVIECVVTMKNMCSEQAVALRLRAKKEESPSA